MEKPKQVIVEKVIGYSAGSEITEFTFTQCIIYAFGIGFSRDPMNLDHLFYTNEHKDDEFKVFPTNVTCIVNGSKVLTSMLECPGIPEFNPMDVLHGEQECHFQKPLKVGQKYHSETILSDVADKNSGALFEGTETTREIDENGKIGDLACKSISRVFIRKIGGFGFPGKNKTVGWKKPSTKPNQVASQKTDPNQAIIYRLAGHYNPLHIDPDMAAMGGFEKPILHGLCSYGVSAKLIVENLCGGNEELLKTHKARFTSYVFPGETLETSMWVDGTKVTFETKTIERGLPVIQGTAILSAQPKL